MNVLVDRIAVAAWRAVPTGEHELALARMIDSQLAALRALQAEKRHVHARRAEAALTALYRAARLLDTGQSIGFGPVQSRAEQRLALDPADRERIYTGEPLDPARETEIVATIERRLR